MRLAQVAKILRKRFITVVSTLTDSGHSVEINPNTKISADLILLLANIFESHNLYEKYSELTDSSLLSNSPFYPLIDEYKSFITKLDKDKFCQPKIYSDIKKSINLVRRSCNREVVFPPIYIKELVLNNELNNLCDLIEEKMCLYTYPQVGYYKSGSLLFKILKNGITESITFNGIKRHGFNMEIWSSCEADSCLYIMYLIGVFETIKIDEEQFYKEVDLRIETSERDTERLRILCDKAKIDLETKKKILTESTVNELTMSWQHVVFHDGIVKITIDDVIYNITEVRSKEIFNLFKTALDSIHKLTIKIDTFSKEIINWVGLSYLDDIFCRLEIENELTNYCLGEKVYIEKISSSWHYNNIKKAFNLENRSTYFDFLICYGMQFENFRITPLIQSLSYYSSEVIVKNQAFLFSFTIGIRFYIVWESVEEGQATHIFRCITEDSNNQLQKVFDYASSSEIRNKLELLNNYQVEYFNEKTEKHLGYVSHPLNDFKKWTRGLTRLLR